MGGSLITTRGKNLLWEAKTAAVTAGPHSRYDQTKTGRLHPKSNEVAQTGKVNSPEPFTNTSAKQK